MAKVNVLFQITINKHILDPKKMIGIRKEFGLDSDHYVRMRNEIETIFNEELSGDEVIELLKLLVVMRRKSK